MTLFTVFALLSIIIDLSTSLQVEDDEDQSQIELLAAPVQSPIYQILLPCRDTES